MIIATILKADPPSYAVLDVATNDGAFPCGLSNSGNLFWIDESTSPFTPYRFIPSVSPTSSALTGPAGESLYYSGGIDDAGQIAATFRKSDGYDYPGFCETNSSTFTSLYYNTYNAGPSGGIPYAQADIIDSNGKIYGIAEVDYANKDQHNTGLKYAVSDGVYWTPPGSTFTEMGNLKDHAFYRSNGNSLSNMITGISQTVWYAKNGHTLGQIGPIGAGSTLTNTVDGNPINYTPQAINSQGDVVGEGPSDLCPTVYYAGGGTLAVTNSSSIYDMNKDTLIGYDTNSVPAVFRKNSVTNTFDAIPMTNLVQDTNYTDINPSQVNDSGVISATAEKDGHYHVVMLLPDYITRDGNMVNSTNNTVWVGQQINLTNMILGSATNSAVTSHQWVIPGANNTTNDTAFYDYEPNATSSNYTNLFTPTNYTTNAYCNFYWSSAGSNQVVYCTNVVYGQTNVVSATFNVNKPAFSASATNGIIGAGTGDSLSSPSGPPYLYCGTGTDINHVGIRFSTNSISPGIPGNFEWIQTINSAAITQTPPASAKSVNAGLDTTYPYSALYNNLPYDSPDAQISATSTNISESFNAVMYLMWQPSTNSINGDQAVWVPLRAYNWQWSATATNNTPTNLPSWGIQTNYFPTTNDFEATNEPSWSTNSALSWH